MVTALLFDFGGTLDANGVTWKERAFRLYRDEGLAVSREAFDPAFYRADDALVGTVGAHASLHETVGRLFAGVTEALRPGDDALAARVAGRFIADMERSAAESARVLARLARRHALALVSNFYGNLATIVAELGLAPLLGATVDSTQVGVSKPDPRIFTAALTALGCGPADAVFVGDSLPRDMMGARDMGMRHVWLVGDEPVPAAPCCPGDPVIRSLHELERLVG